MDKKKNIMDTTKQFEIFNGEAIIPEGSETINPNAFINRTLIP